MITHEMLDGLWPNVVKGYKFLHPNGLSLEELEQKAKEHAVYGIIYRHVTEGKHGNESMEH